MQLPRFTLLRPKSVDEALEFLDRHDHAAELAAGGTDIFPRLKYGLAMPEFLISLKGIAGASFTYTSEGDLALDPLMTLADLVRSEGIRDNAPLLAEAAHTVGSNQIRHMATLGGNMCLDCRCLYYNQSHSFQFIEPCFKRKGEQCYLIPKGTKCWAVFMADTVPALVSLDAAVALQSTKGVRRMALDQFYTGDPTRPFALERNELIHSVIVPKAAGPRGWSFVKSSLRGGLDFAVASVAATLEMRDSAEICTKARITFGAISARPLRAVKAEQTLAGQRLSPDLLRAAARIARDEVNPVTHHGFSRSYLRKCLEVQTLEGLTIAASRAHGKFD